MVFVTSDIYASIPSNCKLGFISIDFCWSFGYLAGYLESAKKLFLNMVNTCENVADLGKMKFVLFMEIKGVEINPLSSEGESWK